MSMRNASPSALRSLAVAVALACSSMAVNAAPDSNAKALLDSKCQACHMPGEDGALNRIDQSRRTPEGWDMTIGRMVAAHGVRLTSEERQTLVKYLADTHGLAPEEVADRRYLLERDFALVETPDDKKLAETCARCHSYGRIALQRRTEEDWRKLAHFHVGQFPTIEIQASGRDRNWWDIASQEMPKTLSRLYPYQSEAWSQWLAHKKADVAGAWRVVGHRPGWGAYEGTASIEKDGADRYRLNMQLNYANGKQESAQGQAIVYTGYEWRATVKQGDDEIVQVFTLSADGQTLEGRWHKVGVDSMGGELRAVRNGAGSPGQVLMVEPSYVKAGTTQRISLYGSNLSGSVDLGSDLQVVKVLEQSPEKVVVEVRAGAGVADGMRAVSVGKARLEQGLALYKQVDFLKIEPRHAMANVGGNGGVRPKIPVQFESVAYAYGPDGKKGTDDDLRLGYMPATWSVANLNANAEMMRDVEFAGTLQDNGLFIPGDAGPNPKRKYGTNNAGELKVTAVVSDEGRQVKASKPLIVTVQRWNDPPIR
ncbi:quinohemoprotein amine dehydrogenase subunit alpha [Pseudomonas aeruginosa]|nr:quinohemoprotein amine dehydrogenase subunit alpha [Pseudomonas aeruginosa]